MKFILLPIAPQWCPPPPPPPRPPHPGLVSCMYWIGTLYVQACSGNQGDTLSRAPLFNTHCDVEHDHEPEYIMEVPWKKKLRRVQCGVRSLLLFFYIRLKIRIVKVLFYFYNVDFLVLFFFRHALYCNYGFYKQKQAEILYCC